jgi:hypothetical protein
MTILAHIIWTLLEQAIVYIQHSFHTDGLLLWCQKSSLHRINDPAHPQRLMGLKCFVNGITGLAHPAHKG